MPNFNSIGWSIPEIQTFEILKSQHTHAHISIRTYIPNHFSGCFTPFWVSWHKNLEIVFLHENKASFMRKQKKSNSLRKYHLSSWGWRFLLIRKCHHSWKKLSTVFNTDRDISHAVKEVHLFSVNIDRALIFRYNLHEYFMQLIPKFGQY